MRDALGPGTLLGYCTNVHAGTTLAQIMTNLDSCAVRVRERVAPNGSLGIGLWLPEDAARALRDRGSLDTFASWLAERKLEVFTINGFPQGEFHRGAVKKRVYSPSWAEEERLDYTLDLINVLAGLRGEGEEGSISTLPLGWRGAFDAHARAAATRHLLRAVEAMERVESETGRVMHLDLEPEPGCVLQDAADVVELFEELPSSERVRRHLRVCHDVCHAAVMFEDQRAVLAAYDAADVSVGKVQLSSALRVRFDQLDPAGRRRARAQLAAFAEERYLHQTTVLDGGKRRFVEDLPEALAAAGDMPSGEWRVHFHVPLFVRDMPPLETTQDELIEALSLLRAKPDVRHYEVETYAWSVLPEELREEDLAEGIAREIEWVRSAPG